MTMRSLTNTDYLRKVFNDSGMSISLIARRADTSPVVVSSVLSGRRNLGIDLAVRLANVLKLDLIEFLQGVGLIPSVKSNSPLQYESLTVFRNMNEQQQRMLIKIAKALVDENTNEDQS